MKRSLLVEVFLGMVAVAMLSVGIAGLIARRLADTAFTQFLQTAPMPGRMMGGGTGRHMILTAAEQSFLAALDRGILVGVAIAFVLAAVAALGLAYYLTRPLERLTDAANALAAGDLDHRVDVSGSVEVERLGLAFNEMGDSLKQAEELRRRMVADVAHELRNPIAALRAQAEGISDGVMAPDPERLASIADDTRYLSRLVDDLQELSSAESGQLRYDFQLLDLREVAAREVEAARGRMDRGDVGVEFSAEADDFTVEGDEGRIRQVLRNLLDNALRHTDAGSVTVAVCSPARGRVALDVIDTGEGIPLADLPYVFERFYRADAARSRSTGGSGIGLSIAKRIVEDHGGSIHALNNETGGATVGFILPLADSASAHTPS